ncbi:cytochrome P450 [Actinomadura cremea]|nr:cytochrome P450 [Actinomadura cremea]
MSESPDPYFMDPEIISDPYRGYGRLREQAPVVRLRMHDGSPMWLITRYEEARAFLKDPRFVHDPANVPGDAAPPTLLDILREQRGIGEDLFPYLSDLMPDRDPPEHTRLRKAVSRTFSAPRVLKLRPRMAELTEAVLAGLPEHSRDGVVDLLEHFAQPMPVTIICELVGVPEADRPRWGEWAGALMSGDPDLLAGAAHPAIEYVHALISRRRELPADDLLSEMLHAPADARLSDVEIVGMVLALVVGGHENTAHLIANGVAALLTHPDQLALLRDDPYLLQASIHELQRWCGPPLRTRMRYAAEDLELGGHRFKVGDQVSAALVSANHDPRKFPEPERLDVTRFADGRGEQHLSFGHGVHYCIGAALARHETEVALAALLKWHPSLALGIPADELPWIPHPGMRRLERLPVRLWGA